MEKSITKLPIAYHRFIRWDPYCGTTRGTSNMGVGAKGHIPYDKREMVYGGG